MNKFTLLLVWSLVGSGLLTAQTWVLSSADQYRLAAPSMYGAGPDELAWLKTFTAQADANALAQVAYWDAGAPTYRWMQIAYQEITRRNLAAPFGTRALALVAVAMQDATAAAWDTKNTYNRQRPTQVDPSITARTEVPLS